MVFLPVTVCTGYLAAWITDLHGFRSRTFVERIFWSIPASIGISTIAAVLTGKLISLTAVVVFFSISALCFVGTLSWERLKLDRSERMRLFRLGPLSGRAMLLMLLWIILAVVSLVDIQRDHRLFSSLALFDHGARVNWGESILRTGVPPANPMYLSGRPAVLRY